MEDIGQFKKRIDYIVCVMLLIVACTFVLYVAYSAVMAIILGIFFAIVSTYAIKKLQGYIEQGYKVSFALFWAIVFALWFTLFALLANRVAVEFAGFYELVSQAITNTGEESLRARLENIIPFIDISDFQNLLNNSQLIGQIQNFFSNSLAVLGYITIVIFIAIYGSLNARTHENNISRFLPKHYRLTIERRSRGLDETLANWFGGRLISIIVVGLLTYVCLLTLDMPFALALAIIAGLLSFIPNIGPLLSVIPALLVAVVSGVSLWWIGGIYLVIQTVESYLITPLVQKKLVDIPPTILLVGQMLSGVTFGLLGVIVVEPLLAMVIHMIKEPETEN